MEDRASHIENIARLKRASTASKIFVEKTNSNIMQEEKKGKINSVFTIFRKFNR
jgi:hypothetical protein